MNQSLHYLKMVIIMDIKRNVILFVVLAISCIMYFVKLITALSEDDIWSAYVIYIHIVTLSIPLIYHIRYSDKNQKIIDTVINTKLKKRLPYQIGYMTGVSLIFIVLYWILAAISMVRFHDIKLIIGSCISIVMVLYISSGLCFFLYNITYRYFISISIYFIIVIIFLSTNIPSIVLLFPLNYQLAGIEYFIGKLLECCGVVILIALSNKISKKKIYEN